MKKPERIMYYESSKMGFLEYVDELERYTEHLEKEINILNDELSKGQHYL